MLFLLSPTRSLSMVCWLTARVFGCFTGSASCWACIGAKVRESEWCNGKDSGIKRWIRAESNPHGDTHVVITSRLMTQHTLRHTRVHISMESTLFLTNIKYFDVCRVWDFHPKQEEFIFGDSPRNVFQEPEIMWATIGCQYFSPVLNSIIYSYLTTCVLPLYFMASTFLTATGASTPRLLADSEFRLPDKAAV